jgi:hypothetical protein
MPAEIISGTALGRRTLATHQGSVRRTYAYAVLPILGFARSPAEGRGGPTYERVLRYPDGLERRIRYPVPSEATATLVEAGTSSEDVQDCAETWETRNYWKQRTSSQRRTRKTDLDGRAAAAAPRTVPIDPQSIPAQVRAGRAVLADYVRDPFLRCAMNGQKASCVCEISINSAQPSQNKSPFPPAQAPELEKNKETMPSGGSVSFPSSPLELLRQLTSQEGLRALETRRNRVRGSYSVLEGCPWVAPKPLYLLAAERPGQEAGTTYVLRTRMARMDIEDEMTRVLGRRRANGAPFIGCSELRDGVVAFEDEADAARFGTMLEADAAAAVSLARCDSHELFRTVREVKGVVVLLRRGCDLPQPHELAGALRNRSREDDDEK